MMVAQNFNGRILYGCSRTALSVGCCYAALGEIATGFRVGA
jgi:hypothetical protein